MLKPFRMTFDQLERARRILVEGPVPFQPEDEPFIEAGLAERIGPLVQGTDAAVKGVGNTFFLADGTVNPIWTPLPNIDPQTNIPYGVINGQSVPDLLDDILIHGTNLTYQYQQNELRDSIRSAIDYASLPERVRCRVDEEVDHLVEEVMEARNLDVCGTEDEYEYEEANTRLWLTYLGGAPLIYVLRSPFVIGTRPCSPCVPNAGDLDNLDAQDGILCYSLPPEWMPNLTTFRLEPSSVEGIQRILPQ